MAGRQEKRQERVRRRSALRSHPLTEEHKLADRVARGLVAGEDVRLVVGVDEHGNPVYADTAPDAVVEYMMTLPIRSRTRPRARFGSR